VSADTRPACRAFEEDLLRRLDEAGPDAPLPRDAGHPAECAGCRELVAILRTMGETFRSLTPPRAPLRLLRSLAAPPTDFAVRREAAAVLDLLTPGVLALPGPSPELMGRLRFLPTRTGAGARRGTPATAGWRRLFSDWRVTVAVAYAVTLLIVALLGVDPMSAARDAASSLTSAGERAVAEAKQAAFQGLDAAARSQAEKPLTERLDYRIYRTIAEGEARAVAYAQIAFDRLFGSQSVEAATTTAPPPSGGSDNQRERRPVPTPEPDGRVLRS
jgi:hypothetical protein